MESPKPANQANTDPKVIAEKGIKQSDLNDERELETRYGLRKRGDALGYYAARDILDLLESYPGAHSQDRPTFDQENS